MKYTQTQIEMIGALSVRWPANGSGKPWDQLHSVILGAQHFVIEADKSISDIEANRDLSDIARIRKTGEEGRRFIQLVVDLDAPGLKDARSAVAACVEAIKAGSKAFVDRKPGPYTTDDGISREIREFCAKQTNSFTWALAHASDPRVFAAIVGAPAFLSGLTAKEREQFAGAAASTIWPEEVKARQEVENALSVAEKAVRKAETMIFERAKAGLLKVAEGKYEVKGAPKRAA